MKPRYGLTSLVLALALLSSCSPQPSYDLIIEQGAVIDGSGAPAREADVGILDGKFAAIGDLASAGAERRIDASGLVVAPGFIDMHAHGDPLTDSYAQHVAMGVTTVLLGQDGGSPSLPDA